MYNSKGKTQKVYKKNKPTLNIIPKNCVYVFPIELVGGKTQVSNQGIMPNRKYYDKGSFLYWQEVFDGRSALKIQWQDSITLEKPEGKNYYLAKPSVGQYYYGKPISSGNETLEISEDASFEDFMSIKASQTITLKFEYEPTDRESAKWDLQKFFRFELVDNDIYNLYMIPELCEEKLMYIADHQEYYDDETGLSKGCEITFATLGDKLQKSGKAIEQYCSWNAPGEFAVKPYILDYYDEDTGEWAKEVYYDYNAYYNPTPIKYLQVEQQGPALTSTIYALGRRQEWDEENSCWKIGPCKILLPCDFITTQPNPLNRSSTPTKNFFCFPDEQVTMVTNAEVIEWFFDKATQPLEKVKNAGMISIGDNWNNAQTPTDNKSNPAGSEGVRKDYFDKAWFPLSYENAYLGPYDTAGCIYAANNISFTNSDTMIDIMCKNAFIYNQQPIIPLSYYSTRPMYLRNIPLIGAIANFFKLGDIKLKNNTTSRQNSHLCFFGDADIMTMCANLNGKMGTSFKTGACMFPINFFGTNEGQYNKLGVNSANTTFCVQLTDQVSIDNQTWDTIYLGQSTREDGSQILGGQSLLANSTLKPVTPATSKFIIDAIVVQSIFDGKIRLSCYGPEEQDFIYPQWTATILSNANWENGNARDWTNLFILSNWEERFCVQEDQFTWPLAPHKREAADYTWNINQNSSFNIESCKTYWQDIPGENWSTTQKIGETRNWKCDRTKQFYEQTISYTDLGKEGVTNKDTFISYFKDVVFSFGGTSIAVGSQQKTIDSADMTFNFAAGTYTYSNSMKLASVRDKENVWNLQTGIADFWALAENAGPNSRIAGYNQNIQVTLTLEDSQIRIKLVDYSIIASTYNKAASGYKIKSGAGTILLKDQKFTSIIKVNNAVFHHK